MPHTLRTLHRTHHRTLHWTLLREAVASLGEAGRGGEPWERVEEHGAPARQGCSFSSVKIQSGLYLWPHICIRLKSIRMEIASVVLS